MPTARRARLLPATGRNHERKLKTPTKSERCRSGCASNSAAGGLRSRRPTDRRARLQFTCCRQTVYAVVSYRFDSIELLSFALSQVVCRACAHRPEGAAAAGAAAHAAHWPAAGGATEATLQRHAPSEGAAGGCGRAAMNLAAPVLAVNIGHWRSQPAAGGMRAAVTSVMVEAQCALSVGHHTQRPAAGGAAQAALQRHAASGGGAS